MSAKFKVTPSNENKDLLEGETLQEARARYLAMTEGFSSRLPNPKVEAYGDAFVLRADLSPSGVKAYGAEQLVASVEEDTVVYVAPRVGHAPDAIAMLALTYGKKCVFFCPASKKVSGHQASLLAYPNVELRFVRIAAMPVLNSYAAAWALRNKAKFLPFGLTGTPLVTAGLVKMTERIGIKPTGVYAATSTGTMTRAFQIGWPDATHYNVAVARNMHAGEIGNSTTASSDQGFMARARVLPPFPTTANYDAKAWQMFNLVAETGAMFVNVGSDAHIMRNLKKVDTSKINSAREWGDFRDLGDV